MKKIPSSIKIVVKAITPPIIYESIRRIVRHSISATPEWITLSYEPLKGVNLYLNPNGSWQKKMLDGSYDSFLFDRIRKRELKGKVIYDIGSHIGYHAYYFAKLVGPAGKVFAFEPNPINLHRIVTILERNRDLKKIITLHDQAVSNKSGRIEFNMSSDIESGHSSGNFIGSADPFFNRDVYKYKNFTETVVPVTSLDEFIANLDTKLLPDIIKLDIEGAESLALVGMTKLLRTKKPVLFIEVHSMFNMFKVVTFLNSLSYHSEVVNIEDHGICHLESNPSS